MKKIVSVLLSLSLIVTLLPAGVFSAPVSAIEPIQHHTINDYAKITSSAFYDSNTLVINIQDLHNNKEVQDNIYKLLESINKKYDNVEVYMEGASEDVNFAEFSSIGIKNTSLLIEKLFKNDKLSGVEYFGYKNNKILKSVEDKYIYDKNIQNYYQLITSKKEIKNLLNEEYVKIKSLNKFLTKEQKATVNLYNKYLNNKISREKFCKALYRQMVKLKISEWKYPNSKLYHDVMKANKRIDNKKVQIQLHAVLADIKANLNYQSYVKLLKDSDNLTDTNFIFSYLSENISKENKTKYSELFKFIKIKELLFLINPIDLVREDKEKVEDILFAESKTVANKEVAFLNLFFEMYKKLLLAEMSAEEYEYYKQNYEYFYDLYVKYLKDYSIGLSYYRHIAEEFNELNTKRNQIFMNKLGVSTDGTKKIKVLVSGGFHTEGLNELLDKNKISHITLTPNIKKNDVSYEQKYIESIVKQAESDFNAISKEPWIRDKYPALHVMALIKQVPADFNRIKKEKSPKQAAESINNFINGHIKNDYSLQDTVKFKLNEDGFAYITIGRERFAETFILDCRTDEVSFSEDTLFTTLAKNIKLLAARIITNADIMQAIGLPLENDGNVEEKSYQQKAAEIFLKHNILFPKFANEIISRFFKRMPKINKNAIQANRVYKTFENVKNSMGYDFENSDVVISNAKMLIGVRPDGFGNTKDYGLLFYVVWEKDEFGAEKAKSIFIADELLKSLENFDDQSLEQFFYDLLWHESWEHIALRGYDKKFNEYILSKGLSATSESFHEYISTPDFASYINDLGYETSQSRLLAHMESVISDFNKRNSEYSDVLSLFSIDESGEYSTKEKEAFLALRLGDMDTTSDCVSKLAEKTYSQLENLYTTQKQKTDKNFDIRKDLNDFIDFLNKFTIVYRKASEYMSPDKFANYIKYNVIEKFSISEEQASKISIKAYEIPENNEKEDFDNAVNQKNILVIEDVISRQSTTFNNIYNSLIDKGARRVYGLTFFDLSKEPEGKNLISDQTFERILDYPQLLPEILEKLNGNTKKYVAYWLTRLIEEENGAEILKRIGNLDKETIKNLMHRLFDILVDNESVRGVEKYEIINIMFSVGLGRKVDLSRITKQEVDEFLKKYDFKQNQYGSKTIEVSYDEWRKDIPALILYAYMSGISFIKAVGVNNIDGKNNKYNVPNMYPITDMCARYNISFEDVKRKTKYSYEDKKIGTDADKQIQDNREILQKARKIFNNEIKQLFLKYYNDGASDRILTKEEKKNYLKEVKDIEKEYKDAVKKVMRNAKKITLDQLEKENIKIDDNLFMILVGGSLAKGNIMIDSDIYYDIVVPDGTISKSIDLRFAPLYSSVLQQIGLTNYHMLKYSTTHMNARDISTFVNEQEIAPFLNYEILSLRGDKETLYDQYTKNMLQEIFKTQENKDSVMEDLAWINSRYSSISRQGEGWIDNSFFISYDQENDMYFTLRPTLMSFETKLNEVIFRYIAENGTFVFDRDEFGRILFPVSVEEQIKFVKNVVYEKDIKMQDYIDDVFEAWQYLSSCRYINGNNRWTKSLPWENESVELINKFVSENIEFKHIVKQRKFAEVKNYSNLLDVIKTFVNDNSNDNDIYRIGDRKASHLEAWEKTVTKENKDVYLFAQAVVLLVDIWSDDTKEKLENLNIEGLDKFLKEIETSINAIKFIDEKFPLYSNISGERSIQNYWRAVAKCAGNQGTILALIAHKLTKAQTSKQKEDEYLLYAVYLPLSKEFGNAEIYEYVRNDLFECSHPGAYLNLLKIIKTLYGKDYSELPEITEKIKNGTEDFLIASNVSDKNFDIKCRVKSLYSIYEKLTSSRRKEEKTEVKELDIKAIKCILNFNDKLFDNIIKGAYKEKYVSTDFIKKEILGYIDRDFNSLTPAQQEQLRDILAKMKEAIFYDHRIVNFLSKNLTKTIEFCTQDGILNEALLEENLKKPNRLFEYWFVNLFRTELRDFIGFHVVIDDKKYDTVVNKYIKGDNAESVPYSFIKNFIENDQNIKFELFEEATDNKQARLKIRITVKTDRFPISVEYCAYEFSKWIYETYGVYDPKLNKISAQHYVYKMGKEGTSDYMENIFSRVLDFSFLEKTENNYFLNNTAERKSSDENLELESVFSANNSGYIPINNQTDNFNRYTADSNKYVTCFVEYDGKFYVQELPRDATIFDLATGKHFSDDIDVAVFNENGEPLTSYINLENFATYKVFKGYDKLAVPKASQNVHTYRGFVIWCGEQGEKSKSDISRIIKKMGTSSYISKLTDIILENMEYERMAEYKSFRPADIADRIYKQYKDSDFFKQLNKTEKDFKDDIINFIGVFFDFYDINKLQNKTPQNVLRRSVQIASHYNLANVLELFELLDYSKKYPSHKCSVRFDDIKHFYETYVLIKTKSKKISTEHIREKIEEEFNIYEDDENYNLIINNTRYRVETEKTFDWDFMKQLMDIEDLNLILVSDKNDKSLSEDKENIFITIDFVKQNALPLMSLGENIEQLIRKYLGLNVLINEDPVLAAQLLLGLYSEDDSEKLSNETPLLTADEDRLLREEIKNNLLYDENIDVNKVDIRVSKNLDLIESEDAYSFATLDVDRNTATLHISEVFLRELDKLEAAEKEKFLILLVEHEIGEYIALKKNPNMKYSDYHKQIEQDKDQKALMDKALEIAKNIGQNIKKIKTASNKFGSALSGLTRGKIVSNDIAGNLKIFAEIIADNLRGEKQNISDISLDMLEDATYLATILSPNERMEIFSVVENIKSWENVLGTIVDSDPNKYMFISEFIKLLNSDTILAEHEPVVMPIITSQEESIAERTDKMQRLMAAA